MDDLRTSIGVASEHVKTVCEADVNLFAGITGDFAPNHTNEIYMKRSQWGRRQAHGGMLLGFMATAVSYSVAEHRDRAETPVSLGFDRVRFLAPVFFGDTVTTSYTVTVVDEERRRVVGQLECKNQDGTLVAVANHIEKWVPN
jgi:3-hydroxybutyryl-CoA dehydratase